MTPDRRRVLRAAVFLLGLAGLAVAVRSMVVESSREALPDWWALLLAGLASLVALLLAGRSWMGLFGTGQDRHALTGALYTSQLAKYLPLGGLAQAAGQLTMSVAAGAGLGQVATALAIFGLLTVVAGCVISGGLVFAETLPTWARALAILGPATPLIVNRRVLVAVLTGARRLVRRIPRADTVPPQAALVRSLGWSLGNMAVLSLAFAILLRSLEIAPSWFTVMAAFSASWVVGYLVFPVPGGIGIREALLILVLSDTPASSLLAASLALRLVILAAEATAVVANRVASRTSRRQPRAWATRAGGRSGPGGRFEESECLPTPARER
jgi:glycosyltransferase 2 family protein